MQHAGLQLPHCTSIGAGNGPYLFYLTDLRSPSLLVSVSVSALGWAASSAWDQGLSPLTSLCDCCGGMWWLLQGKNRFTKNIQFGPCMVQELSEEQQNNFSQLSLFRHVRNIKLYFSWREKRCFMLIVTIKKEEALQRENEFTHKHTLKILC